MSVDHAMHQGSGSGCGQNRSMHYRQLAVMAVLSFVAMFVLMYAMVNSSTNVYANSNQAYMAGLMTAPMVLIELIVMRAMYSDRRRTAIAIAVSVVLLVGCWTMIRRQTGIGDSQFLRSMIPHHAGAILMCEQAATADPRVKALCKTIISSQQAEIDEMKGILARLQQ